jgi:hypothetical protein
METMSDTGKIANVAKTVASPEKWLSGAHDIIGKFQNMKGMASILTNPNAGPLLRKLIQLKAGSSQATAIAARLIMQARGAGSGGPDSREPSE